MLRFSFLWIENWAAQQPPLYINNDIYFFGCGHGCEGEVWFRSKSQIVLFKPLCDFPICSAKKFWLPSWMKIWSWLNKYLTHHAQTSNIPPIVIPNTMRIWWDEEKHTCGAAHSFLESHIALFPCSTRAATTSLKSTKMSSELLEATWGMRTSRGIKVISGWLNPRKVTNKV